jgi:hypothetical protein
VVCLCKIHALLQGCVLKAYKSHIWSATLQIGRKFQKFYLFKIRHNFVCNIKYKIAKLKYDALSQLYVVDFQFIIRYTVTHWFCKGDMGFRRNHLNRIKSRKYRRYLVSSLNKDICTLKDRRKLQRVTLKPESSRFILYIFMIPFVHSLYPRGFHFNKLNHFNVIYYWFSKLFY